MCIYSCVYYFNQQIYLERSSCPRHRVRPFRYSSLCPHGAYIFLMEDEGETGMDMLMTHVQFFKIYGVIDF